MSKGHRTLRDLRSFVASASGIKMFGRSFVASASGDHDVWSLLRRFSLRDHDVWSLLRRFSLRDQDVWSLLRCFGLGDHDVWSLLRCFGLRDQEVDAKSRVASISATTWVVFAELFDVALVASCAGGVRYEAGIALPVDGGHCRDGGDRRLTAGEAGAAPAPCAQWDRRDRRLGYGVLENLAFDGAVTCCCPNPASPVRRAPSSGSVQAARSVGRPTCQARWHRRRRWHSVFNVGNAMASGRRSRTDGTIEALNLTTGARRTVSTRTDHAQRPGLTARR